LISPEPQQNHPRLHRRCRGFSQCDRFCP